MGEYQMEHETVGPPAGSSLPSEQLTKLGMKIRQARQQQSLTLKTVADRVGLTPSHISQMERGVTHPSVSALLGIAGALGLPMEYFFSSDAVIAENASRTDGGRENPADPSSIIKSIHEQVRSRQGSSPADSRESRGTSTSDIEPVVRSTERQVIKVVGGIEWHRLTPSYDQSTEFIVLRYEVGASGGEFAYTHQGREYGFVMQGRLTVELGFSTYVLEPGDSISFDCTTPHRLINAGDEPVVGIWVILDRY
jgi:transcriptional regulator with XRE-family HTH domain